jgi:hypothetical protein
MTTEVVPNHAATTKVTEIKSIREPWRAASAMRNPG